MRGVVIFQGCAGQPLRQPRRAGVDAKRGQKRALGGIAIGLPACGERLEIDMGG